MNLLFHSKPYSMYHVVHHNQKLLFPIPHFIKQSPYKKMFEMEGPNLNEISTLLHTNFCIMNVWKALCIMHQSRHEVQGHHVGTTETYPLLACSIWYSVATQCWPLRLRLLQTNRVFGSDRLVSRPAWQFPFPSGMNPVMHKIKYYFIQQILLQLWTGKLGPNIQEGA